MSSITIAVLIACHNRKQKTLSCLERLFQQTALNSVGIEVYLVDDGSQDGTPEAVRQTYPQVKLLQGDGSLFWNRSMHWAFSEAIKQEYDYYLWLNDDTFLYLEALQILLETSQQLQAGGEDHAIVVGSTQDAEDGKLTYGGMVRLNRWHPFQFRQVIPGEEAIACDTMNGNFVLIPRSVVQIVGNLDPTFTHRTGDVDYGLRARQQNCSIWIAPSYIGTCQLNPPQNTVWNNPHLTFRERLKQVNQPKNLPFQEHRIFAQRHASKVWGGFWFIFWLLPYVRVLLVSLRPRRYSA